MKKFLIILLVAISLNSMSQPKACVRNDSIIYYQMIDTFYSSTMDSLYTDYSSQPNLLHVADGWKSIGIPQYDENTDTLGNLVYNKEIDMVIYQVIPNIEKIRKLKHSEFERILEEEMTPALSFSVLVSLILGDTIPQDVISAVQQLRIREDQVRNDIDTIMDIDRLKNFSFDPEEIKQSRELLKRGRYK